jgi:CotH kinase protein
MVGLNDASKPLRSKLLAVPALRARYITYVRDIAERWLDWNRLGPLAKSYQAVVADEVKLDTRKLYSTEAFETGLEGGEDSLRKFVETRREFLLKVTGPQPGVK